MKKLLLILLVASLAYGCKEPHAKDWKGGCWECNSLETFKVKKDRKWAITDDGDTLLQIIDDKTVGYSAHIPPLNQPHGDSVAYSFYYAKNYVFHDYDASYALDSLYIQGFPDIIICTRKNGRFNGR